MFFAFNVVHVNFNQISLQLCLVDLAVKFLVRKLRTIWQRFVSWSVASYRLAYVFSAIVQLLRTAKEKLPTIIIQIANRSSKLNGVCGTAWSKLHKIEHLYNFKLLKKLTSSRNRLKSCCWWLELWNSFRFEEITRLSGSSVLKCPHAVTVLFLERQRTRRPNGCPKTCVLRIYKFRLKISLLTVFCWFLVSKLRICEYDLLRHLLAGIIDICSRLPSQLLFNKTKESYQPLSFKLRADPQYTIL